MSLFLCFCLNCFLLVYSCLITSVFMGFSRQESWSGFPFPSPGDLPKPGIEPRSPALQADSLPSEQPGNVPTSSEILKKNKKMLMWGLVKC